MWVSYYGQPIAIVRVNFNFEPTLCFFALLLPFPTLRQVVEDFGRLDVIVGEDRKSYFAILDGTLWQCPFYLEALKCCFVSSFES